MRLIAAFLCMFVDACSDEFERSYADYAAVKAEGVIEKGWIPQELPREAKHIRVEWNIDTNRSRGSYDAPTAIDPIQQRSCHATQDTSELDCGAYRISSKGKRHFFHSNPD